MDGTASGGMAAPGPTGQPAPNAGPITNARSYDLGRQPRKKRRGTQRRPVTKDAAFEAGVRMGLEKNARQAPGEMPRLNLRQILRQAREIRGLVGESTDLEGWVEDKITTAKDALNSVAQCLKNERS